MKSRILILISLISIILGLSSCENSPKYIQFSGYAQGGTYSVKLNLKTTDGTYLKSPEKIKNDVDSILLKIDNSLSGYNKLSLLSKFNKGEIVEVNDIFIDIYEKSYGYYELTEGAVDVASAPLFDIWGFGFKNQTIPSVAQVEATIKASGLSRMAKDMKAILTPDNKLDPNKLLLEKGELPMLNYNAVAQGYSCDLIADYLKNRGVSDFLVDVGGEIYCIGSNPNGKSWTIGIDKPVDGNMVKGAMLQSIFSASKNGCAVVTSGNYRKFYIKDGKKYAHTIDPRKGYPVEHNLLSATIIANDATMADAMATYCMVLGLEEAKKFLDLNKYLEAFLVYDHDGELLTWKTKGFTVN